MAALLARCRARKPEPGAYLPSPGYVQSLLEASQREAGIAAPRPARADEGRSPSSAREGASPPSVPGTAGAIPKPLGPAHVSPPAAPVAIRTPDGLPISLSAREVEVLQLIAEGKSNQEISAELFLALNTVKRHAYNIFTKLDVKNRTQAVTRARQLGLIP
jgi:DNA-binding NarL/FixJ family response regulator